MPISVSLLEPHIILQRWTGHISIDDLKQVTQDILAIMNQQGYTSETPLISIIDGDGSETIEVNIRILRFIAHHEAREVGIYIVNAPHIGRILAKLVSSVVSNKEIQVCTGMQQALQSGRTRLDTITRV